MTVDLMGACKEVAKHSDSPVFLHAQMPSEKTLARQLEVMKKGCAPGELVVLPYVRPTSIGKTMLGFNLMAEAMKRTSVSAESAAKTFKLFSGSIPNPDSDENRVNEG